MKLPYLTTLILNLNALLDARKEASITEVRRQIEARAIFEWLEERFGREIDLSLYDAQARWQISADLLALHRGYDGSERRKWGVENNGLCLLIAWVNEIVQQKWGDQAAA